MHMSLNKGVSDKNIRRYTGISELKAAALARLWVAQASQTQAWAASNGFRRLRLGSGSSRGFPACNHWDSALTHALGADAITVLSTCAAGTTICCCPRKLSSAK
jgi:hypothetical protein